MPQKGGHRIYRLTSLVLSFLSRLFDSRIRAEGVCCYPDTPIIYAANHFTRFETFIIPYIIHKSCGAYVRTLAGSELFRGAFGTYLESLGALGVEDENRDRIIISDLLEHNGSWLIFPEGMMVKDKNIYYHAKHTLSRRELQHLPHTGIAVLAMQSVIYRELLANLSKHGEPGLRRFLAGKLGKDIEEIKNSQPTRVVPINLSYYPIRPGDNKIKRYSDKIIKKMPARIEEELAVEGSILLGGDVHLNFLEPVDVASFIGTGMKFILRLPLLSWEAKVNAIIRCYKYRLTYRIMDTIYHGLEINIDHLVCGAIHFGKFIFIEKEHFKRALFLTWRQLKSKKYHLHQTLAGDFSRVIADENYPPYEDIITTAVTLGILEDKGYRYRVNRQKLTEKFEIHSIRLENIVSVIAKDLNAFPEIIKLITKNLKIPPCTQQKLISALFRNRDQEIYKTDYHNSSTRYESKPVKTGAPFLLAPRRARAALIISHGYKAGPGEIAGLAEYMAQRDIAVYGVRLRGHATAAQELARYSWEEWYESYNRGYMAMRSRYEKIYLAGFSTGGLLALLCAVRKKNRPKGLICINTPLRLRNIASRIVPAVHWWNEVVNLVNLKKLQLEYIDDPPEYPDTNYRRNYIKGVLQLEKLMEEVSGQLGNITVPSLVIQAADDPVVHPASIDLICENIAATAVYKRVVPRDRHVIIRGAGSEEIFEEVYRFISGRQIPIT